MSDFVGGGQIVMHSVNMFMQVLCRLLTCVMIAFAAPALCWYFHTTTEYERHVTLTWGAVNFKIYMHGENSTDLESVKVKYLKKFRYTNAPTEYKEVETSVLQFFNYCTPGNRIYLWGKITKSIEVGVWGGLSIGVLIILYFRRRGLAGRLSKFIRGGVIATERDLIRHIRKLNRKVSGTQHRLAGIPYPYKSQEQNTLVIGSTGSGKTQLISDLVAQIRKRGEKVIIFDKKCDYLGWFYDGRKDYILNPFDKRSEQWNLLGEIEHMGMIKTIAESFVPSRGHANSHNDIWDEAARIVFTEVVTKVIKAKNDYSNEQIVDLMLRTDVSELAEYVKGTMAQGLISTDSKKSAISVILTLATHFNGLRLSKGTKKESFSIRRWLKEENRDSAIFITSQSNFESELGPLETAWFEIIINGILAGKQNSDKKTWIILDELAGLQKIPSLQRGLSAARSYGGCFVLGLQNIAQMKEIYGIHHASSISSECNTRAIFKTNEPETSKWVSENIGDEEIIETNKSLSYGAHQVRDGVSISSHSKVKPLVLASQVQNMDRMEIYLKMVDCPVIKKKLKYKERKIVVDNLFVGDSNVLEAIRDIDAAHKPTISKDNIQSTMGYPYKIDPSERDIGNIYPQSEENKNETERIEDAENEDLSNATNGDKHNDATEDEKPNNSNLISLDKSAENTAVRDSNDKENSQEEFEKTII